MISEGKANDIIDVDGSHLYKKRQRMIAQGEQPAPLGPPPPPPSGWIVVTAENHVTLGSNIPPVSAGMLVVIS